mmetsp:Transcript_30757/g.97015  ORF Transcript_30757/g.97015 Transcript_30757/m.97015 type:complete len:315 (-) Transcript_30757:43-987(-)
MRGHKEITKREEQQVHDAALANRARRRRSQELQRRRPHRPRQPEQRRELVRLVAPQQPPRPVERVGARRAPAGRVERQQRVECGQHGAVVGASCNRIEERASLRGCGIFRHRERRPRRPCRRASCEDERSAAAEGGGDGLLLVAPPQGHTRRRARGARGAAASHRENLLNLVRNRDRELAGELDALHEGELVLRHALDGAPRARVVARPHDALARPNALGEPLLFRLLLDEAGEAALERLEKGRRGSRRRSARLSLRILRRRRAARTSRLKTLLEVVEEAERGRRGACSRHTGGRGPELIRRSGQDGRREERET